ncbi:MAG: hypothetical protein WCX65_03980 [bacterium]
MFFFASFYSFIRFLEAPGALNAVLLGLSAGLALLSKFTSAILPPLLFVLLIFFFFTREFKVTGCSRLSYACWFAAALAVAVFALNAGYGFQNVGMTLSASDWRSGLFNSLKDTAIGRVPLPFPRLYLDAFDAQFLSKSRSPFIYYLNGELSRTGWASYYWIALLLKTPIPLLAGSVAALAGAFRRGASFKERALWAAPAVFLLEFTFFVRIDMGLRYLLPIVPFLIALSACAFVRIAARGRGAAAAVVVLCVWYGGSIFWTFGNGLAYFNEIAGGPGGGHRYLVESNLDWGQNLVRLKEYVDEKHLDSPLVSNYGLVPASAYGIKAGWVPCEPVRAVIAVSVNHLMGVDPYQRRSRECFRWLTERKPVVALGYGMYVYDTRKEKDLQRIHIGAEKSR